RVSVVIVTNANHSRAAAYFAEEYRVPVFAANELAAQFRNFRELKSGTCADGLIALSLEGAAPGEFALYDDADAGSLVVGDALINFDPYTFALLPAKYCTSRKRMIKSLRGLLDQYLAGSKANVYGSKLISASPTTNE